MTRNVSKVNGDVRCDGPRFNDRRTMTPHVSKNNATQRPKLQITLQRKAPRVYIIIAVNDTCNVPETWKMYDLQHPFQNFAAQMCSEPCLRPNFAKTIMETAVRSIGCDAVLNDLHIWCANLDSETTVLLTGIPHSTRIGHKLVQKLMDNGAILWRFDLREKNALPLYNFTKAQ